MEWESGEETIYKLSNKGDTIDKMTEVHVCCLSVSRSVTHNHLCMKEMSPLSTPRKKIIKKLNAE